jgi:hypothetical protein
MRSNMRIIRTRFIVWFTFEHVSGHNAELKRLIGVVANSTCDNEPRWVRRGDPVINAMLIVRDGAFFSLVVATYVAAVLSVRLLVSRV